MLVCLFVCLFVCFFCSNTNQAYHKESPMACIPFWIALLRKCIFSKAHKPFCLYYRHPSAQRSFQHLISQLPDIHVYGCFYWTPLPSPCSFTAYSYIFFENSKYIIFFFLNIVLLIFRENLIKLLKLIFNNKKVLYYLVFSLLFLLN